MSTHIAGHVPLAGHEEVAHPWKLWIAAAVIAVLTTCGVYLTITQWRQNGADAGLAMFGAFVGPAVTAAIGYFWCLPEVLGGVSRDEQRTLAQKWSDYSLLSSFIAILVVEGGYFRVIQEVFHDISLPRAIALLAVCPWILAACIVASEEYLSWTMPGTARGNRTGWRPRVRTGMERWGRWLLRPLTTKVALVTGAGLVLLSLVLVVSGDIFGPDFKGYEVVAGGKTYFGIVFGLGWAQRVSYLLGILLALLALAGVLAKGAGRKIRGSGMLGVLAGMLSLLEVTKLAVTWNRHDAPTVLALLWLTVWVVPVVIWLMSPRGDKAGWNRTRVAIMVFYLPLFLLWLGFLPFITYLALGYGVFMAGILLMWWGFLQGSREDRAALELTP